MSDDNFNELLSTVQEKVIKYSPSRRYKQMDNIDVT